MKKYIKFITIALFLTTVNCSSSDNDTKTSVNCSNSDDDTETSENDIKISVYSGNSISPASQVLQMSSIYVGIQGLNPYERFEVKILDPLNSQVAVYILNATGEGTMPPALMWDKAGLAIYPGDTALKNPVTDILLGKYSIVVTPESGTGGDTAFTVISGESPLIWASDSAGNQCSAFRSGNKVYVTGTGFRAGRSMNIYILRQKSNWQNGEIINDTSYFVSCVNSTASPTGKLGPVDMGNAATSGECCIFDVIADTNNNGIIDNDDAVDGKESGGFAVQVAPPALAYYTIQLAYNNNALDYNGHNSNSFYFPDEFLKDGSDTGFAFEGAGKGVHLLFNPVPDERNAGTQLIPWSFVQMWIITVSDFSNLFSAGYDLTGKNVTDALGRPCLVSINRSGGGSHGPLPVWCAPLTDRRPWHPYIDIQGYVVIIEKPDNVTGQFENKYHPDSDFIDGDLNGVEMLDYRGFRVFKN